MTTGTTRAAYSNGILTFYDTLSSEIVLSLDPIVFDDDFLGLGHTAIPTVATAGSFWLSKIVKTAGTVTVSAVANGAGGIMQLATSATSEAQEAVLYFGDQLTFNGSGIVQLKYITRVQLPVIPTSGTKAVFGLGTAWVSGPNNVASYVRFAVNGSGLLLAECYDGTTSYSVSTGITISTTTEWHELRIDMSNSSNILFYVDGTQVCTTTTFAWNATTNMQPYHTVYKASGTSVGTVNLDFVAITGARQ